MLALFKKTYRDMEWIVGFTGTPSDMVGKFLSADVDALCFQTGETDCDPIENTAHALKILFENSEQKCVTRQDIENLDFSLGEWTYRCIGCAETQEEAAALCDLLEAINATGIHTCASTLQKNHYRTFLRTLRRRFSALQEEELQKLLSTVVNLKL